MSGIDRFFIEAAYFSALAVHLIETKDSDTDVEIVEILIQKPYFIGIMIDVLEAYKPA